MMFEATVQINNVDEYNLFALFMSNLVAMREKGTPKEQHPVNVASPTREQIKAALDAQYGTPEQQRAEAAVEDEAVVGSIGTPDATITDAKVIEAFQQYALRTKKGPPELLALLKKYDATKVSGIAQKRRAEFLAEINA